MRQYPTAAMNPNRKQRKAQRRTIFYENQAEGARIRKARKDARKAK